MSRTPEEILTDALAHFDTLCAYAKRDLDDQVVIDAVFGLKNPDPDTRLRALFTYH